jgi:tryptophanyl-tRNA synthetase
MQNASMNSSQQIVGEDPQLVRNILQQGGEAARDVADETLNEVKAAIGLKY